MDEEKKEKIETFLQSLGKVKKNEDSVDGFHIICKKCGSRDVVAYNGVEFGSEYTGMWGSAGIKCLSCGNAAEIFS